MNPSIPSRRFDSIDNSLRHSDNRIHTQRPQQIIQIDLVSRTSKATMQLDRLLLNEYLLRCPSAKGSFRSHLSSFKALTQSIHRPRLHTPKYNPRSKPEV